MFNIAEKDKVIQVGVLDYPPYSNPCSHENPTHVVCEYPGIDVELFMLFLAPFRFKFNISEIPSIRLSDNFEDAVYFVEGRCDIFASTERLNSPIWENETLTALVDVSLPVYEEKVVFIIKSYRIPMLATNLLLSVFQPILWIVLIAGCFMLYGYSSIVRSCCYPLKDQRATLIASVGLNILLGIYASVLAIQLSNLEDPLWTPFNTEEELSQVLQNKQCKMVIPNENVYAGSAPWELICPTNATTEVHAILLHIQQFFLLSRCIHLDAETDE